jgi:hypothetical protein
MSHVASCITQLVNVNEEIMDLALEQGPGGTGAPSSA